MVVVVAVVVVLVLVLVRNIYNNGRRKNNSGELAMALTTAALTAEAFSVVV